MQPASQQAPAGQGVGASGQAGGGERRNDLSSWWKTFKQRSQKREDEQRDRGVAAGSQHVGDATSGEQQGIFGVPLQVSVRYANVAISLSDGNGQSYIYGYVPIVVAKCGVFLKERATDVEGIFRLSGSEKRIKELWKIFNTPDRYGKGLDWTGYTVHDAANILRRYFNQLPEPIIPLEFYDRFRDPLRNHQSQAVGSMEGQSPSHGDFDQDEAIVTYQDFIKQLPPLNRQLLLYILDLLAVFASKSDMNKMTTANLAAIFQPGILSHPSHDMAVQEYRLSQDVLIFLIENQDHFLIGMPGTAADEQTVQEVESGPPTPAHRPSSSNAQIGESGSNSSRASGGVASGVGVRRSVSASSRKSKGSNGTSGAPSPVTPVPTVMIGSPTSTSGVHRSNTLPSRSPNLAQGRFAGVGTSASIPEQETTPTKTTAPKLEGEDIAPTAIVDSKGLIGNKENVPLSGSTQASTKKVPQLSTHPHKKLHSQPIMHEVMSPRENMPALPDSSMGPPPSQFTPSKAAEDSLQHRRQAPDGLAIPTSPNINSGQQPPSDQTTPTIGSNQKGPGAAFAALFGSKSPSLGPTDDPIGMAKKQKPNKLQKPRPQKGTGSMNESAHSSTGSLGEAVPISTAPNPPITTTEGYLGAIPPTGEFLVPLPPQLSSGGASASSGSHLKPGMSPAMGSVSAPSHTSDVEEGGDLLGGSTVVEQPQKRKWFPSRRQESQQVASSSTNPQPQHGVGSNGMAATSHSSVISTSEGRRSVAMDRGGVTSDSEQEATGSSVGTRRDPISWMKGKLREGRDRLRVASPTREPYSGLGGLGGSTSNLDQNVVEGDQYAKPSIVEPMVSGSGLAQMVRGKSFEVPRGQSNQVRGRVSQDIARTEATSAATLVPDSAETTEKLGPKGGS